MKLSRLSLIYFGSIILGLLILAFSFWQIKNVLSRPAVLLTSVPTSAPSPTPTPDPDRQFSILLMGYGGGTHDGGRLTDSIIQAVIKPHRQQIELISIPRDLWVNVKVGSSTPEYAKINYAFPSGGGELASAIVSEVTGIKVDHYLALDFSGFTKVIDLLGGVDVKITAPFTDPFYPIEEKSADTCGKSPEEIIALEASMSGDKLDQQFTCRYETLAFNVGTTHLDGTTALKYARSRHSAQSGGDFNRSQRQRQIILAVRDKVLSLNFFTKIIPIYQTVVSHITSDLRLSDLESYLPRALEFSEYKVVSLPLTDQNVLKISISEHGQSILMPTGGIDDYAAVRDYLQTGIASEAASNK